MSITPEMDFLTKLRRDEFSRASAGRQIVSGLKVMLRTSDNGVNVTTVDLSLKPVSVDPYSYSGALGRFLKAYQRISDSLSDSFSWGGEHSTDSVRVQDFPYLAPLIADCQPWLVDKMGKSIEVDNEACNVDYLVSDPLLNDTNKNYRGKLLAKGEEIIAMLSDTYTLTSKGIRRVVSVGDRFAYLTVFNTEISPSLLDAFFSVFYSTAENITVHFGSRKTRFGKHSTPLVSTLIFEKIDGDNSLHLRVSQTVGTLSPDMTESFQLSKYAAVSDVDIEVRDIEGAPLEESVESIRKDIVRNSPSRTATKDIWQDGNLFVIPPEVASPFLYNVLPSLLTKCRLIGTEKLKSYNITAAQPKLSVKLSSGIDFLEGSAKVEIGSQTFSINDILAQYGHNKYVTLSDGSRALLDEGYIKRLQRIFRRGKGKSDKIKVSFFDLPEVMQMLEAKQTETKAFDVWRKFYDNFNSISTSKVSTPGLKAKLRGYQSEGLKWINYMYKTWMGGCLADDMGLGKTVQTIAMLCHCLPKATAPCLIVMPRSLLFNWEEEFKKFAPKIKIATYYGTSRDLDKALEAQVVMTSYAVARNDVEQLSKVEFEYIILDESQNIKNVDAMVTKSIWLLNGKHRLAISGTPIENNLTELYSLYHFLNPAMFGSLKDFTDKYVNPIQRDGDEETASALRRKIFPFMLRRLKKDVLTDLPERTEQTLTVEMSPAQAKLYEQRRAYYACEISDTLQNGGVEKARFELLRALSELRQIASIPEEKSDGIIPSPKIDLLVDNISQATENGHKVVVFFNFLAGIELTGEKLTKAGIGYDVMTGATSDRRRVVENFQNNPDCQVLLMTVKTGGVGLNLVCADTVFVVEPWWNKAAEDQAINRLHRIGQKNAVNCYYMITSNTIEEKIRQLQEQKSALVDAVISSDSTGAKALSPEDISYLLS